jgi:DNA-directed RNA polymerase specialized sigma24 family protein
VAGRAPRGGERGGLPEEQREALVVWVYAGLTFEQMAEVLGQPLSTVSWRYRRALDRLGERMGPKV